jgi:exodeoxyribonuclease VII large subunit
MNANHANSSGSKQPIFTVDELNRKIKQILEDKFPFLWILGEISNFRVPSSGHCYFTLKDQRSQIGAVMFRNQANLLKFRPEDGLSVVGLGRISVYEPRGTYQIIFEYLEPKGIGGLQLAFEQLKQRLSDQGLFADRHKRTLPAMPGNVSIITSPSGAAVRDFINVAQRRFPNLPLVVVPVPVQGDHAPEAIVRALQLLNATGTTDVIVLTRGGGSIEDLWAFNDEQLARAIFASRIPIVSAVGHETDFTIADFVADLRAPTPSAAAELIIPAKKELINGLDLINQKLYNLIFNILNINIKKNKELSSRILHPRRRLQDLHMRLDEHDSRLVALTKTALARERERVAVRHQMLLQASPGKAISTLRTRLDVARRSLFTTMHRHTSDRTARLATHASMLDALNPMAILKRGYSITRKIPGGTIVRNARQVAIGQQAQVLLGNGQLTVTINQKEQTQKEQTAN